MGARVLLTSPWRPRAVGRACRGSAPPLDQGEEPALDALAEELARLGQVPRVESDAEVQEILEVEGAPPDAPGRFVQGSLTRRWRSPIPSGITGRACTASTIVC